MKDQATHFPHHRLDVYRLALDMARLAKQLADRVPRGYRSIADHLLRAAGQTVLLIGEGANRYGQARRGNASQRLEASAVRQPRLPSCSRYSDWYPKTMPTSS